MAGLTYDEVDALATTRYDDMPPTDAVFALLVDVADRYVSALEAEAADDPAPYLGRTTPLQCALLGLKENLDLKRDGTIPQLRDDQPDGGPS